MKRMSCCKGPWTRKPPRARMREAKRRMRAAKERRLASGRPSPQLLCPTPTYLMPTPATQQSRTNQAGSFLGNAFLALLPPAPKSRPPHRACPDVLAVPGESRMTTWTMAMKTMPALDGMRREQDGHTRAGDDEFHTGLHGWRSTANAGFVSKGGSAANRWPAFT